MGFTSIPIRNIIREAVARGGIIVDVRDRDEFLEGHIPMAVNIPFELIEAGVSSMKAALIMSEDGYRVINTVGGLAQYRGPLTRQR